MCGCGTPGRCAAAGSCARVCPTLRRRLANAAASKLASLKKAVVGDDAQPDLSLEGLAISRDAF